MKAVVYNGPKDVSVNTIDDPKIEKPTDVIIRVTTTNICGSDLHMYEGRTSFEKGRVFGHEDLGEVIEVGPPAQIRDSDAVRHAYMGTQRDELLPSVAAEAAVAS